MIWFFWFNSVGCESNIFWVLLAESQIYMYLQELLLKLLVLLSSMKFSKNYLLPPLFDLLVIILIQCSLLSMVTNSYQSISSISVLSHSIAESDRSKRNKNLSVFSDIQYWNVISEWTMFFCSTTGLHTNKCFSPSRKTKISIMNCFSVLFLWPLNSWFHHWPWRNKTQLPSDNICRKSTCDVSPHIPMDKLPSTEFKPPSLIILEIISLVLGGLTCSLPLNFQVYKCSGRWEQRKLWTPIPTRASDRAYAYLARNIKLPFPCRTSTQSRTDNWVHTVSDVSFQL